MKSRSLIVALVLASLAYVVAAQTQPAPQAAKPKAVQQDEFYIVGLEAKTSAAKEMSGNGIIGQQWQKFFMEGVLDKIPNRADSNLYAIYTDFTNGRAGDYSLVIGVKVTDKTKVPEGLALKAIPAGKYAIFQSEKGPAPQVIPAAWMKIAASEDKGELGYTRTYKADYEVYDLQAMNPENLQAEIHVGVK